MYFCPQLMKDFDSTYIFYSSTMVHMTCSSDFSAPPFLAC